MLAAGAHDVAVHHERCGGGADHQNGASEQNPGSGPRPRALGWLAEEIALPWTGESSGHVLTQSNFRLDHLSPTGC